MVLDSRPQPDRSTILKISEQAQRACAYARVREEAGDYEAACDAIKQWWRMGERPRLDGLDQHTAAEVLLRAGTLCGWMGSMQQMTFAQRTAEGLLNASIYIFQLLKDVTRAAEGQIELGYCHYREGSFDLAREAYRAALQILPDTETDLRAIALVRCAILERHITRLHDALDILNQATLLAKRSGNLSIKGRYHLELATTLKNLGAAEKRDDYVERASEEYATAIFYFEKINHLRYQAVVENNIGFLLLTRGEYYEAHRRLERARVLFASLNDNVRCALVDETQSRAMLAEERYSEAERTINEAVTALERSGEQAFIAEALTTKGVVLSRLKRYTEARETIEVARRIAERCGDREGAGRACLTLIEELCDLLTDDERREIGARADHLLAASQHAATQERLRICLEKIAAAHAEYERRREQIAHAERLATLGEIAFGVAHNVNNSLTGILGRAQLLLRDGSDPSKVKNGLQTIVKAAQDGAHIVQRIQDFARQRRDREFTPLSVQQLLMDVSEISRTGLTQRIIAKRQTDAPEGIPIKLITEINCQSFVLGDATELREVLVNMIFNAVDAMPEGGEIMLRAEEVNESVIISVSDTGIGMSDEVRRRVFDPFFSTKGDAGTGMGLAISFGIIRRHDGNVEVESQLGAGATFRIQLPLASSDELAAAEESAARPPQALSTRPTKFLIIDDEEYVREILKDILEAEGYEVVTAATGQEGIEAFDAQTFDAIFTDVQMPRMTGWEVARAVRERNLRIPLALISGLGETVDTRQQKEALIDWIVSKPFDLERIVKIAGEVAGRRAETTQDDLPQTTSVVEVVTVQ